MIFGELALDDAEGAILAHSLRLKSRTIGKGTLLTRPVLDEIRNAGIDKLFAARPAANDVGENEAARRIAGAIAGSNLTVEDPVHGRSDLFAIANGLVALDRNAIERINLAQSVIQVATLPEHSPVEAGQIVATVKVIPFAVAADELAKAEAALEAAAIGITPYRPLKIGVVATLGSNLKEVTLDKTRRVLAERLAATGATIADEIRTEHRIAPVAEALRRQRDNGHELLILFGASATSDAGDVVPAAIEAAGGVITAIGMPVDPGNLLVLGDLDGVPVIGAPGCARSPAPSGFDWVLQRLLTGQKIGREEIAAMGVGGVLAEKRARRFYGGARSPVDPRIDAVILAAGASSRMGGQHKLLANIGGRPLIRIVAEAALASTTASVSVVVGHQADRVRAALFGLDLTIVENPDYRDGMSSSLRSGLSGLDDGSDGAVILLGDMPEVDREAIDALIALFDPSSSREIVVPTYRGKAGNPVVWGRRYFPDLMAVTGDKGGREIIRANSESVSWVEIGPSVTVDLDTPEAMENAGGTWT